MLHVLPAANSGLTRVPVVVAVSPAMLWCVGLVFAATACGLTYFLLFHQKQPSRPAADSDPTANPGRTPFDELVETHELSQSEANTLQQVARELNLAQPTLLFVDPALLVRYTAGGKSTPEIESLAEKLFGNTLPEIANTSEQKPAKRQQPGPGDTVLQHLLGHLPTVNSARSAKLSGAAPAAVE